MALWRACVDPNAAPIIKDPSLPVIVGVDASTKRDSTALVAVTQDRRTSQIRIVNHRIFQPTRLMPLDFESTVEATLLDWRGRYALRGVYYDPYQMAATAQRLQRAGIRMIEYPQTPANLTAMGSNLFELIRARSILAYPNDDIHTALTHAIVKESARGLQITKEKSSHKIDVVVALAMAALAAVEGAIKVPQRIPMIPHPDLTKSDAIYSAPNTTGFPKHYLKRAEEPWRKFVNADGSISPRGAGGGKWWGPIGQ
jgi:phage terminase large subunit-like protein